MQITVTTEDGALFQLDVSEDLSVCDLKALLEAETGIEAKNILLIHNMAPLVDEQKSLSSYYVASGDIIVASRFEGDVQVSSPEGEGALLPPDLAVPSGGNRTASPGQEDGTSGGHQLPNLGIDWSSILVPPLATPSSGRGVAHPGAAASRGRGGGGRGRATGSGPAPNQPVVSPEMLVQHYLANPEELATLQQQQPQLAQAILSGDLSWVVEAYRTYQLQQREIQQEWRRLAHLDPWSEEYQHQVATNIQQRNIRDNMETAIEFNPEIFAGRVVMLYISCHVNGVLVKALVDTGAQMTIMNVECAERCNVMRLVDRRFASYAFGVGRQRIIGVIHLGQVQIGGNFLASSFRVLEDQSHDLILGLDMLKRHQCCVDLSKNVLRIGTTGSETPFLSEQDVPMSAFHREERGILEEEDREMASAIVRSEQEHSEKSDQHQVQSSSAAAATSSFPEELIQKIVAAGFTREQAIAELQQCTGNAELALAALLAKSITF